MKICLISNLYPPISRGGAEKVAEIVARGLRDLKHEVFVISTKPWHGFVSLRPSVVEESGLEVYRFYPLNIFYYLNDYKHNVFWRMKWHFFDMFNFHSQAVVKKILKKEKPDLVMTHNLKGIGYLIPRIIRKLGIKHIHILHDVQLSVPSGLIIKGQENSWQQKIFLRKWYEAICRRLFDSPDIVVSPSKWLLNFYIEKGFFEKSKKVALFNPVSVSHPDVMAMSKTTKQSRGNEIVTLSAMACNDKLSLLYLGQIEEHKGILFLIKALTNIFHLDEKRSQKEMGDWQLHIIGGGSKVGEVKKMVGDDKRFIIHGKLPSEKIAKIFNEIDLTIVPSLCYENSPTVIYESLSAGVPVAAAKIGGVAELIHDGQNGFTFEAGNVEDLARVLKYAASDREKLQKMRLAAQKSVEDFRIENYVKKLFQII